MSKILFLLAVLSMSTPRYPGSRAVSKNAQDRILAQRMAGLQQAQYAPLDSLFAGYIWSFDPAVLSGGPTFSSTANKWYLSRAKNLVTDAEVRYARFPTAATTETVGFAIFKADVDGKGRMSLTAVEDSHVFGVGKSSHTYDKPIPLSRENVYFLGLCVDGAVTVQGVDMGVDIVLSVSGAPGSPPTFAPSDAFTVVDLVPFMVLSPVAPGPGPAKPGLFY